MRLNLTLRALSLIFSMLLAFPHTGPYWELFKEEIFKNGLLELPSLETGDGFLN